MWLGCLCSVSWQMTVPKRLGGDPGLTLGRICDVFHPSHPMPGGFPLGIFFHPQKGSKLSRLEPYHKADGPARTCSGWRKINGFTFLPLQSWINHPHNILPGSWKFTKHSNKVYLLMNTSESRITNFFLALLPIYINLDKYFVKIWERISW